MAKSKQIHWGRVLVGGFLAELIVFAIVFPVRYLFGQRAFLVSILIASAVLPFIFAVWVGRHIDSRFVLHGALVGVVAALIYMGLAWGQPQPLLYKIAHGLKLVGGTAGGVVASRWRPTAGIVMQSE
jgi:hypothetical protein